MPMVCAKVLRFDVGLEKIKPMMLTRCDAYAVGDVVTIDTVSLVESVVGNVRLAVLVLLGSIGAIWFAGGWWGSAEIEEDTAFIVPSGATLTSVANALEEQGLIDNADGFLLRAKILGSGDPVQAGEFNLPAGSSQARILDTFQHGQPIRRLVTIPEGLPSTAAGIYGYLGYEMVRDAKSGKMSADQLTAA